MVQLVLKKFKIVGILVNNAGIIKCGSIEDIAEEDWDRVIQISKKISNRLGYNKNKARGR